MRYKRISALLLALLLVAFLTLPALAGDGLTISAGSASGKAGETVKLDITVENNPGFSGMSLTVGYDPKVLTLTDVENQAGGSFAPNMEKGVLTWLLGRNTQREGVFFTLCFRIDAGAKEGTYPITLSLNDGRETNIVNEDAEAVPVTFVSGTVTVTSGGSSDGGSGGSGTAEVEVKAETADGSAAVRLDGDAITAALEKNDEADKLVVTVESRDSDAIELNLDSEAVGIAAEAEIDLVVETSQGSVTVSGKTLAELSAKGGDMTIGIKADEDGGYTLSLTLDDEAQDVKLKAALPAAGGQVLVAVKDDGSEEIIKKSLVEDGKVYAEVPAGARVKTVDNRKTFEDVKADDWFADSVDFASSHELFRGVSDTEFAPNLSMTRAMLVTVIYRLENEPDTVIEEMTFDDVEAGSWYEKAVAWASEQEIVLGTGDGFEPDQNITREQIATVLFRYAKYLGLNTEDRGSLEAYPDGSKVSSWAQDAMAWAVQVGLFRGDENGNLNPGNNGSRAEVATLMMRFIRLIVK